MLKPLATCQSCGAQSELGHCNRCFWRGRGVSHHHGLRAIVALLDDSNVGRALESCGGMVELQDLVADLAKRPEEWDVHALLADAGMEWLQSY